MRKKKYIQQEGVCCYCGSWIHYEKASLDHVIPVELLDSISDESNLVMCCKDCNYNKGGYIVFTNLYDRVVYPMIEIPYVFKWKYIITNFKDEKCVRKRILKNSNE